MVFYWLDGCRAGFIKHLYNRVYLLNNGMQDIRTLIVKGKYCFPGNFSNIKDLKNMLVKYMSKKAYEPENYQDLFFLDGFLTINFRLFLQKEGIPLKYKIKRFFNLMSDLQLQSYSYFNRLKNLRNEYPFDIRFSFRAEKINDGENILIEVISIPVAYYKISQGDKNLYLDNSDFSNITFTNEEFIREVMGAISAKPIEEPKVIVDYVQTEVSKKLIHHDFKKISKLLNEGKTNLELGKDSVGQLLGVIENFLFDLVSRLTDKPAQLHQPEKNIDKLEGLGYINNEICGTIQSTLFHGIYRKLKDKDHKKEEIEYFDLALYYKITENVIDYLIDRVIKYKIKTSKK